jgi:hypothetical protein
MRRIAIGAALLLCPTLVQARTWVIPHVLEKSGMSVVAVYAGGLDETAAGGGGATLELRLYASDGKLAQGPSGRPLCNPCSWPLTAQARKQMIDLSALAATSRVKLGFGIFTVSTPAADDVALQVLVTDPRTNEAVFGYDPPLLSGGRVAVRSGRVIPKH